MIPFHQLARKKRAAALGRGWLIKPFREPPDARQRVPTTRNPVGTRFRASGGRGDQLVEEVDELEDEFWLTGAAVVVVLLLLLK